LTLSQFSDISKLELGQKFWDNVTAQPPVIALARITMIEMDKTEGSVSHEHENAGCAPGHRAGARHLPDQRQLVPVVDFSVEEYPVPATVKFTSMFRGPMILVRKLSNLIASECQLFRVKSPVEWSAFLSLRATGRGRNKAI
jgi:hypothetical protein